MATKVQREERQKIINNLSEEANFKDITTLDGVKAYTLFKLSEIISSLQICENDDDQIASTARELKELAEDPQKIYNTYLHENKRDISEQDFMKTELLEKHPKFNINTTERALLQTQMSSVLMEYLWKNRSHEEIDYGAIRVRFELAYKAFFAGLEEKIIESLDIYVGYGDILSDLKIVYKDSDETYNLKQDIIIHPFWNPLDKLYNQYSIYKHRYINFEESCLNSLATAYETDKQYENRQLGRELLSYNGIALNYLSVLEIELKKLIHQRFNIDSSKIRLVDAINYLNKGDFGELSDEVVIKRLHEIRELRNKAAHGYAIIYEECQGIRDFLIDGQVFDFISWNLKSKQKF